MPFTPRIEDIKKDYPEFDFIKALTPSEQKAAFHVRDQSGNDLCLKIISPAYDLDRLNREIHTLRSISHNNIASLKEYCFVSTTTEHRHHLIEEFIEGSDLSDHLQSPWDTKDAIYHFSQLFSGLEELRKARIVHRDLKPSNIRRRSNGTLVIIDFGVARHLDLPAITNTLDGAAIGTPIYFAPEQFLGNKYDIDHRTDLFAAGILFYQALTGHHPFYDGTATGISEVRDSICLSNNHLNSSKFNSLDRWLQVLLSKLLKKDRAHRPAAAGQVAEILGKKT